MRGFPETLGAVYVAPALYVGRRLDQARRALDIRSWQTDATTNPMVIIG